MNDQNEIDPVEIEKEFRAKAARVRPFAGFFDWPHKETKELGIVGTLIGTVGDPLSCYKIRPGRPDPPDVIGSGPDGKLAAIEVTELTDGDIVGANVKAARNSTGKDPIERMKETVHRDWDRGSLISAIAERLQEKDGKILQGGPFDEYLVVLHTDEAMLTPFEVGEWLRGHDFPVKQITGAYLLFSYDGAKYPYLPIPVIRGDGRTRGEK